MGASRARSASSRRTVKKSAPEDGQFPLVAIGATAGGLEAVNSLFQNLPADHGMAFVVLIHHDHRPVSAVAEVISRATKLPVSTIPLGSSEPVERDRVYVAPPGAYVSISQLSLSAEHGERDAGRLPIDDFFRMLAEDLGNRAIGVILSGSASDGMLGVRAIKEEGGITFAQDSSAQFSGMPDSATAGGAIDFVMSPAEIASELISISRSPYLSETATTTVKLPEKQLATIFAILQAAHQVDFTH